MEAEQANEPDRLELRHLSRSALRRRVIGTTFGRAESGDAVETVSALEGRS